MKAYEGMPAYEAGKKDMQEKISFFLDELKNGLIAIEVEYGDSENETAFDDLYEVINKIKELV